MNATTFFLLAFFCAVVALSVVAAGMTALYGRRVPAIVVALAAACIAGLFTLMAV